MYTNITNDVSHRCNTIPDALFTSFTVIAMAHQVIMDSDLKIQQHNTLTPDILISSTRFLRFSFYNRYRYALTN